MNIHPPPPISALATALIGIIQNSNPPSAAVSEIIQRNAEYKDVIILPKFIQSHHFAITMMYYLKHEHECFIRYKTRGAAERFISDKARIASVLIASKTIHFIPILSLCLQKNFEYRCCISRENRGKSFVKIYVCFIIYKDSFTAMIFFVFCS